MEQRRAFQGCRPAHSKGFPLGDGGYGIITAAGSFGICRLLSENGRVLETDSISQSSIVAISAPPTSLNEGVAAVLLHGDILYLAAYAQEGLIKQHTAKKIIAKLTELVK